VCALPGAGGIGIWQRAAWHTQPSTGSQLRTGSAASHPDLWLTPGKLLKPRPGPPARRCAGGGFVPLWRAGFWLAPVLALVKPSAHHDPRSDSAERAFVNRAGAPSHPPFRAENHVLPSLAPAEAWRFLPGFLFRDPRPAKRGLAFNSVFAWRPSRAVELGLKGGAQRPGAAMNCSRLSELRPRAQAAWALHRRLDPLAAGGGRLVSREPPVPVPSARGALAAAALPD